MATDARAALIVLAVVAGGCNGLNKCRNETLLISLTLDAKSAAATTLDVAVSIAGSTKHTSLTHSPGSTSGTVEVRFPAGYPSGRSVVITVVAKSGAGAIGGGTTSLTLSQGCATASVVVSGGVVGGGNVDLAGADLYGVVQDMVGGSGYDLYGLAPDMCPTHTEDCFNGVDDNCDGLVDCADPQCTGGATPSAECVPDPGSATSGTLTAAACGSAYTTSTTLDDGLNAGTCDQGSCSCPNGYVGGGTPTCTASLKLQGTNAGSCANANGTLVFSKSSADGCFSYTATNASDYYQLTINPIAACNAPTGTPTKTAPTWTATHNFCSGAPHGGGCPGGGICVPVAPKHCVLLTGDQVACSVAGYGVADTTHYFTGFDDSGRSCSCKCASNVQCSTAVTLDNTNCSILNPLSAGCYQIGSYDHGQITTPANPQCLSSTAATGTTTTAGFERTVCCTN